MPKNWQDPAFAEEWDARHLSGNPARAENLALLLAILDRIPRGQILDLGCGSGLVAHMVLERFPDVRIFGIDSSSPMLDLARDRLATYRDRVRLTGGDLTAIDRVDAPSGCPVVVAVQSLHHLTEPEYRSAVRWTYDHLAPGGWFFIIDRLGIPSEHLYQAFFATREHQGQVPNPEAWSGYLEWLETNSDRPLAVQTILSLLEQAGFLAAALDVRADRGMLIARRPAGPATVGEIVADS